MSYQRADNSATLFANDRKKADNQPDMKGEALIGGVAYWVSCWNRTTKNGETYLSLAFNAKDDRQ